MARVVFGRLLAVVAFGCALFLAAVWVTQDRPTAWLARLAGDDGRAADRPVTIPAAAAGRSMLVPPAPPVSGPAEAREVHHRALASPAAKRLPPPVVPAGVASVVGAP